MLMVNDIYVLDAVQINFVWYFEYLSVIGKLFLMVQKGLIWTKIIINGPKWSKIVQEDFKMIQNGLK